VRLLVEEEIASKPAGEGIHPPDQKES
jgi:hypothetical protein